MGELLDNLNSLDARVVSRSAEQQSVADQFANIIQTASSRAANVIDAGLRPGRPLDILTRLVRKAPLQSLGLAFLVGVAYARRR